MTAPTLAEDVTIENLISDLCIRVAQLQNPRVIVSELLLGLADACEQTPIGSELYELYRHLSNTP